MPELRILLSPLLLALALTACSGDSAAGKKTATRPPAPVAVGSVEQGPITLRRVFSGTLEAAAEVQIAARVSGPVERIAVDLGDAVKSGEVIAWIDDDELVQASLQAEADLAVAEATLREAQAGAEHAARTLQRRETLGAQASPPNPNWIRCARRPWPPRRIKPWPKRGCSAPTPLWKPPDCASNRPAWLRSGTTRAKAKPRCAWFPRVTSTKARRSPQARR
ncbi:MAG: biotin/lipoyl-binding protein [Planctomycetota bacterium]